MTQLIKRWLPTLLWAGLIFTFSSIPTLPATGPNYFDFIIKKSAHVFVYAVLFFLSVRAARPTKPQDYLLIFIGCTLYAISDEIHQSFVPGRTPHPRDVGFDILGMILAYTYTSRR